MIDTNEIERLLNDSIASNIICYPFEFRHTIIAPAIKKIANIADDYGYIIIGASTSGDSYTINGASRGIFLQAIIDKAIAQLTVKPQIEYSTMNINEKNIYVIKVYRINEGTALLSDKLNDTSITEFINRLYNICIKLQGNTNYINATEDVRNDYIRDMLEQYDYIIKDQTRRGLSATRTSAGEVDILVEKDKIPFTIIEALNLDSLNQDYLAKHLNKIYTYDTTGNLFNVCLVYAELKNFASFWEKYCSFVKKFVFPYPTISVDENVDDDYNGSEIKIMTTTHNRSGHQTKLYHICVKIMSK